MGSGLVSDENFLGICNYIGLPPYIRLKQRKEFSAQFPYPTNLPNEIDLEKLFPFPDSVEEKEVDKTKEGETQKKKENKEENAQNKKEDKEEETQTKTEEAVTTSTSTSTATSTSTTTTTTEEKGEGGEEK